MKILLIPAVGATAVALFAAPAVVALALTLEKIAATLAALPF